jgi:copper transport protein
VIALALILASLGFLSKKLPHIVTVLLPWTNLMLGSTLLIAVTLSGHAAAVESCLVMPSIIMDGLHILAAALWVGGICYLAIIFLPVLRNKTFQEQAQALLSTLSYYSPLAIVGVCVMAGSGA